MYNAVKHYCGHEAARWQAGFDARNLKPVLGQMGCLVLINDQDSRSEFNSITERPLTLGEWRLDYLVTIKIIRRSVS